MRTLMVIAFFVFCWLGGTSVATAQDNRVLARTDTSEVRQFRIYYPVNKTRLYPDYMSNPHNLRVIREFLAESPRIDSIIIYSYASPEGPYSFNKKLSRERGLTAKRYLLSLVPSWREMPDSVFRLRPEAENWEGLREEVDFHYHEADRDEVLAILDSDLSDAEKKAALQRLNGRRSWRYIIRNIMPKLRYATWISVWAPVTPLSKLQGMGVSVSDSPLAPSLAGVEMPYMMPYEENRTILALKTNLLYDLLTWANFSVEVPFTVKGHQFSALYQHQFPWWTWGENDNEYCNRFLSLGGEVRWWFRPRHYAATTRRAERDCLTGWYAGLYGLGGKWDFERRRDICYQGEFWSAGLTVGYAMPISRHLNIEFSLAAGYANIPYRGYTPTDDYGQLIRDPEKHGTWHYIGPTRAEVSLVVPITLTRKGIMKKGGGR